MMPQDQPDKVIEIPNVGRIAFPASMTSSQIDQAAAKLYRESNPRSAPKPPKSWISTAVDWLPAMGGAVGGVVGGIPGAAMGGAAGQGLKRTAQHATELPGAVTDVGRNLIAHPKETIAGFAEGAMGGAKDAAVQGALQGGAQAVGAGLVKGAQWAGPALMTSALKPAYAMTEKAVKAVELPRVVKTLLDEGVNVTQAGIGKINTLLKSTNDEIASIIKHSKASVYPEAVAARAEGTIASAGKQVAPSSDVSAATGIVDEFMATHGGAPNFPARPIPVQMAQELKKGTYRAIGSRAYGETKGAALEAEKALARGLKEGIETAHPEVQGLNAREGSLIEAKDAIAKRVAQAANRDPGGIGWIAENPKSFVAFLLARSPAVKSMLARGFYQSASRASGVPENLIRLAMGALAASGDDE